MPKKEDIGAYFPPNKNEFELIAKSAFWMEHISAPHKNQSPKYHYHDCYELYYLIGGERYYFIQDKTYPVKSGQIVLIESYDIHGTSSSNESGYERILINFKQAFLEEFLPLLSDTDLFACFSKKRHVYTLTFQEQCYVETLLKGMLKEYKEQETGYSSYLKTALIQLLIFLNRRKEQMPEDNAEYPKGRYRICSDIAGYINHHYGEDITLDSICERFFISRYYFSRTFKKSTGFTFIEYLNSVRVKEAQKLLVETTLGISEISQRVGYKNITHFGRVFKNLTGVSPLYYRKVQKKT